MSKLTVFSKKEILLFFLIIIFIFKPPFKEYATNAIIIHLFSFVSLISMFSYRRIKIKIALIAMLLYGLILYQTISFNITAAYPLATSLLFLYFIKEKNISFSCKYNPLILLIPIALATITIHESHIGRYSLLNGDPNYTCLLITTLCILLLTTYKRNYVFLLSLFIITLTIILTQSRTGLLALFVFYLCKKTNNKLLLTYFIIVFSIIAQFILAYLLPSTIEYFDFGHENRFLNFNDKSNIDRIYIYKLAFDFLINNIDEFWFHGIRNYLEVNTIAENIPHNWFIQSIIGFGLTFTITYIIFLLYILYKLGDKIKFLLPFICYFFIYASFLSYYPLTTPFLLTLLFFFYLSKKYNAN
ncbi:O-antigen ligase family protein [Xenorhabdus bovienii]|uniref:O-antigen ligase family protein n=1 Tax=Xenorhabdus bovienii TaxID=40576 RepID=UPI00237C6B2F|nr:O-antigen ligase family protein [Xenorhabdus bovienii]MDE1493763.1 O-antigen ligase family protein [Xenorhabdus bovienii]MDE9471751.1 O-antigen ligase family protein [Xenorhabdus bovienii]